MSKKAPISKTLPKTLPSTSSSGTPAVMPLAVAPAAVVSLPASYAGLEVQPPQYDPTTGQTAFGTLAPNRAAIPASKIVVARVDVQAAALVALGAYGFLTQATVLHAQLQALDSAGLFLMSTLTDLETAAFAALYAFSQVETVGAFTTAAIVPPTLAAQASAVEKRMKARCEYVFSNDPTVRPLLDMLRPGTGYSDLANDLLGYASIYAAHKTQIEATNDPNYVATDVADAETYAGQLLACLSAAMGPTTRAAFDDLQASWTLLLEIYAEVRTVALALMRFDAKASARFPSLTSAARARAVTKKTNTPGTPAPAAPTAPTTSTPPVPANGVTGSASLPAKTLHA